MKILIDNKEVPQENYVYDSKTGTISFRSKLSYVIMKTRKWWQFWKPKYAQYIEIQIKKSDKLFKRPEIEAKQSK